MRRVSKDELALQLASSQENAAELRIANDRLREENERLRAAIGDAVEGLYEHDTYACADVCTACRCAERLERALRGV